MKMALSEFVLRKKGIYGILHVIILLLSLFLVISISIDTFKGVPFYEHSGDWMYTAGIPAKSGVGGGVMAVLPGVMGVSAFAPPLDEAGNSVKAQLAVKFIMNKLGLGVFNGDNVTITE